MRFEMQFCSIFLIFIFLLITFTCGQFQIRPTYRDKHRLPKYQLTRIPLKTDSFTVSGHSSGAAAATHFYLSYYAANSDGIALFSSIHFLCGGGSLVTLIPCLRGWGNSTDSIRLAHLFANANLIEPLDHMRHKRHYIFHGNADPVIHFDSGVKVFEFFDNFSDNVRFKCYNAAHSLPTKTCGISCGGIPSNPGTGCSKCDFSAIYDGLNYLYGGNLVEPTTTTCRPKYNKDGLTFADQSEFMSPLTLRTASLLPDAVLYTPPQCRVNSSLCTLHIAFHGCRHSIQNDGMDYLKCSGYMEMADSNNFIVLFPQVRQSPLDAITLFHCWDLYGYTGPLYGTRLGSQNQVIARMVGRILGIDVSLNPISIKPGAEDSDYFN
ncbi:uncharacterized protein LOC110847745 isoform X1 [Folsomia candida]|uniref:uncharacterized protein LOC110847745 isoform X1 n=2 Tax=Folsomia candida TaxID=158441 RepID=UPI001604CC7E|nr:uncharacterized protein LOC110847745 isoform X1 [Folsomia candida]